MENLVTLLHLIFKGVTVHCGISNSYYVRDKADCTWVLIGRTSTDLIMIYCQAFLCFVYGLLCGFYSNIKCSVTVECYN